jgi:hypothetical protein
MSDLSLSRLRSLRSRANVLLDHLVYDLVPFVKDDGSFRRTPTSSSTKGDVNVTTTCSCWMALAAANKFKEFFGKPFRLKHGKSFAEDAQQASTKGAESAKDAKSTDDAESAFKNLIDAPWMSSGLTANNAFTTSLVMRVFGFLKEEYILKQEAGSLQKSWALNAGLNNLDACLSILKAHDNPASEYIWLSLTEPTRELLNRGSSPDESYKEKLHIALSADLRLIIQSGWIYSKDTFDKASNVTQKALEQKPTGYPLAELNQQLLADQFPEFIAAPRTVSFSDIADLMASNIANFSINQYPPSAAVVYWFVDGLSRAKIKLHSDRWKTLSQWAAKEFNHERSLVAARHASMMDPIALGMSACLCARLNQLSELGAATVDLELLPSQFELERAIEEIFALKTDSGLWNKYFPMFHYQDAGSNFCFTFELIEAVLHEFGNSERLFESKCFLDGLESGVNWCESNRLPYHLENELYEGWNSGGNIQTLEKEQPESWATAVVHMFLYEITSVVSEHIQKRILKKYDAQHPKRDSRSPQRERKKEASAISQLLDIAVRFPSETQDLSTILWDQFVDNFFGIDEAKLRRNPASKKPVSALLFGPPGTSKTEVTKSLARDLEWPFIEITPSNFVKGSLEQVYLQADEIFEDLMDLSGVLVFFDEMDALVQTRNGGAHLDVFSQFLTTTMLPKLTRLHDGARVIFIMATNYQDRFDAAIKRSGRFDLLLCMGPPKLQEKLDRLHVIYKLDKATDNTTKAGRLIDEFLKPDQGLVDQFALLTFGELKEFMKGISKSDTTILSDLTDFGSEKFRNRLAEYSEYVTLRMKELEELQKLLRKSKLEDLLGEKFSLADLGNNFNINQTVRYLLDRRQSRVQY